MAFGQGLARIIGHGGKACPFEGGDHGARVRCAAIEGDGELLAGEIEPGRENAGRRPRRLFDLAQAGRAAGVLDQQVQPAAIGLRLDEGSEIAPVEIPDQGHVSLRSAVKASPCAFRAAAVRSQAPATRTTAS
jgi:hypothetical protein